VFDTDGAEQKALADYLVAASTWSDPDIAAAQDDRIQRLSIRRDGVLDPDLVGVAHVGIGLDNGFSEPGLDDTPPGDFDAGYWWPQSAGYERAIAAIRYTPIDTWVQLAPALRATGMQADEVALVLGGNMLRVARQVWHG